MADETNSYAHTHDSSCQHPTEDEQLQAASRNEENNNTARAVEAVDEGTTKDEYKEEADD